MSKSRTVNVKTPRGMIQATYGPIRVTDVREHKWREDVAQAEIRQTVTRHYPSARAGNSITDALFSIGEYDFSSSDFDQERVAWINIPLGKTKQDVEKQLEKFDEATIYRVLADNIEQVLTKEQLFAIDSPEFDYTLEQAQNAHIIMLVNDNGDPSPITSEGEVLENAVELNEDGRVTKILNAKGLQYVSKGFALQHADDIDMRAYAMSAERVVEYKEALDEAKIPAGGL